MRREEKKGEEGAVERERGREKKNLKSLKPSNNYLFVDDEFIIKLIFTLFFFFCFDYL